MTFDHRIVDGVHIAKLIAELKRLSANPAEVMP
jgi:pyruvate/2-oxoglutarate dehydrogenase complex dihydrolipoamide acyltransferase (E2) component